MEPINKSEIPEEILAYVGQLNRIVFPQQGCTSDVAILNAASGRFVLKRARTKQFCSWLEREIEVLKILENSEIQSPAFYHSVKEANQIWALFEWFNGETVREFLAREQKPDKHRATIYNFGRILSKIHSTACPNELKGKRRWLENMLESAQYNLDHYEVDGSQELLDRLKQHQPEHYTQTLIHGDFTIDNVLVDQDGNVTGVIDWSGGAFGDPRYDVSLAIRPNSNAFQRKEDRDAFFDGYGERIISDRDYEYFDAGLYEFF